MAAEFPSLDIDHDGTPAPFEQLRLQLAAQISDERLTVGTKLPTVRAMAAHLDLAVNTVARSYRELESAGLIVTKGRAGTFVAAGGNRTRHRAQQAAQKYVATVHDLGLEPAEALKIVRAAFDA